MALDPGSLNDKINSELKTKMKNALDQFIPIDAEGADPHRQKFVDAMSKSIAEVISHQVLMHILDNLEIKGVEVTIPGNTYSAGAGPAAAFVPLPVPVNQSNDGTGLVK